MKYYFVFILMTYSFFAFSQNKISEKDFETLQSKARMHVSGSLDSSFYYANKIELSNNNIHKAFAKSIKSYLYQLKGDTISSNLNFEDATKVLEKTNSSTQKTQTLAFLYLYKGLTNWKRKKYYESILNYEKAKKYSISINDKLKIISLNNNMALVYGEMGNYSSAIRTTKYSDKQIDGMKLDLPFEEFKLKKNNIYLSLGILYNRIYNEKQLTKDADSAIYFFNKSLLYSDKLIDNKNTAESNLANLYLDRKEYRKAENIYFSLFKYAGVNELLSASYSLGRFYFKKNEFNKSLIYFKKVDSLHVENSFDDYEFMNSKYFQAKIFDKQNKHEEAVENANLFILEYENANKNMFLEVNKINLYLESKDVFKEIDSIKRRNKNIRTITNTIMFLGLTLVMILIYFLFKIKKDKKIANDKIKELILEFRNKKDNHNEVKKITNLTIDNEKELEILNALERLEEKKYFLSMDFNQQNVAKKIKTNTTYLSHVVNKNFEKTFSDYSNELKVNYAIEELINNPTYRKYSTQAIAESVGFKNANSFTKSFKKRAGVTPAQFIKNI